MGIPVSLILIAAGAILTWGVTDEPSGLNLDAIGVILMVVGIVGARAHACCSGSRGGARATSADAPHTSKAGRAGPWYYGGGWGRTRRATYVEDAGPPGPPPDAPPPP